MTKTQKLTRLQLIRALKATAKAQPGVTISRDYFIAQTPGNHQWSAFWPTFAAFLKAAGLEPAVRVAASETAPVVELPLSPEQRFELDREKLKVKSEDASGQLKFAMAENAALRKELDDVLSVGGQTPQITIIKPKVPSGSSESVAVILASDWHCEENVESAAVSLYRPDTRPAQRF